MPPNGLHPGTLGVAARGFPPRDLPDSERSVARSVLSVLGPRLPGFGPHCLFPEPGEGISSRLRVRTVSPAKLRPRRWLESPGKQGSSANLSEGFRAPSSFPQITESRGDVCVDLLGELGLQD